MAKRQATDIGWFERWRAQRRTKREQVLDRKPARSNWGGSSTRGASGHGRSGGGWFGFGGDAGGCSGGDGGGFGGGDGGGGGC